MKNMFISAGVMLAMLMIIPSCLHAQSTGGVQRLHMVLENLYNKMITLSIPLIDVARAIAGFGALWYIGYRVWKHIANAEPVDFFALLRPFAILLCLTFYPALLSVMNGVLKPMVISTDALVKDSNKGVERMLEANANSLSNSEEWQALPPGIDYEQQRDWSKYEQPEEGNNGNNNNGLTLGQSLSFMGRAIVSAFSFVIKLMLSFFLQILYYAAALCIDALRTFHLIILAILGPFVLCLSIYDGFQHTLPVWLARYINIYLWLPIANLLGAMTGSIQQGMLGLDINQAEAGNIIGFGATDIAYLIFLIIAIIGYFTIPSIANYIVHASSASAIMTRINSMTIGAGKTVVGAMTGGIAGAAAAGSMSGDSQGNDKYVYPMSDANNSEPYVTDHAGYQHNKVSGNS